MTQILETINQDIDSSITVQFTVSGDNEYRLIDSPTFYNAVEEFNKLIINEDDANFIDWLDTKVRIGAILVNLKDKPSGGIQAKLSHYDFDRNTLEIAEASYGTTDSIGTLYLLNNVNSDYELKTFGHILTPEI